MTPPLGGEGTEFELRKTQLQSDDADLGTVKTYKIRPVIMVIQSLSHTGFGAAEAQSLEDIVCRERGAHWQRSD